MNRKLKFRAWDIYAKPNKMVTPNNGDFIGWHSPSNWDKCYKIMQFTGLKDMNGKDIYEGDILKGDHSPNSRKPIVEHDVVVWLRNGWKRESYNGEMKVYPDIDCRKMEVIGNIYENPELCVGEKLNH